MGKIKNFKKVCSFYVSSTHLVTMILPYINKQLEININFSTFLEYKLKGTVYEITSKLLSTDETKNKILDINWNDTNGYKYTNIELEMKKSINEIKELNILIIGSDKFITATNENLEKYFIKNKSKLKGKYINIINCYEVAEFNDNIREILDTHDAILNTSGIHDISEVFEGYEKKIVN